MKSKRLLTAAALAAAAVPTGASAALVPSNQPFDTIVGATVAGQTYTISISGFSTLCQTCNGGGALTFDSNGIPIATPVGAYAGFGPNGSPEDPSTPGIDYGIAGPNFNLGSLVFIFTNPSGGAFGASFSLQNGQTFTPLINGTLNAIVNDTNFGDNAATGFTVTFVPTAVAGVPEPATWAMMMLGFGMVGGALRSRRRRTTVAYA